MEACVYWAEILEYSEAEFAIQGPRLEQLEKQENGI